MTWVVGDRVRNKPDFAWVYDGVWGDKLALQREGVVVEVPHYLATTGKGTVRIKWDSLTGGNNNADNWVHWTHTDHIERLSA